MAHSGPIATKATKSDYGATSTVDRPSPNGRAAPLLPAIQNYPLRAWQAQWPFEIVPIDSIGIVL
jgi:hypothetical protein